LLREAVWEPGKLVHTWHAVTLLHRHQLLHQKPPLSGKHSLPIIPSSCPPLLSLVSLLFLLSPVTVQYIRYVRYVRLCLGLCMPSLTPVHPPPLRASPTPAPCLLYYLKFLIVCNQISSLLYFSATPWSRLLITLGSIETKICKLPNTGGGA
jgi:hypothetical protein